MAGRKDRDRRRGDRAAIFAADDFGDRAMVGERSGVQQGLGDAIAQGGVQPLAVVHGAVDLFGQVAEAIDRPAAQQIAHRRPQELEMLLRPKQRIAPGDAGQDHIDADTESHLTVIEPQHHRDRRSRLDDLREAGADGLARIGKAVGLRTGLDRGEVPVEEPAAPDRINDVLDPHQRCPHPPHYARHPLPQCRRGAINTAPPASRERRDPARQRRVGEGLSLTGSAIRRRPSR